MGHIEGNRRRATSLAICGAIIASVAIITVSSEVALAATFTVNTVNDGTDALPGDAICETGPGNGVCTLRAAVQESEANDGADVIAFGITGAAPFRIDLFAALPPFTQPVTIDGYTQPGATRNLAAATAGSNAIIRIEIDGNASSSVVNGLDLRNAPDSTVSGLSMFGFNGAAIQAGPGSTITGNFIGLGSDGTTGYVLGTGVDVNGATGTTIGGPLAEDRNIIGGFVTGITVSGSDDVTIANNLIGLAPSGSPWCCGQLATGVEVEDTSGGVVIGGLGSGNVISNSATAVDIGGPTGTTTGVTVSGNLIGTDPSGLVPFSNGRGIVVGQNAIGTRIGGTVDGEGNLITASTDTLNGAITLRDSPVGTAITGNVIADNDAQGVLQFSGSQTTLRQNSMHDNAGPRDWLAGIGINDPADADEPTNNRGQNYPTIGRAEIDTGADLLQVSYTLDTATSAGAYPMQIDFYGAEGDGEARVWLGSTTHGSGPSTRFVEIGGAASLGAAPGDQLVATATDANGNTSNFSTVAFLNQPERMTAAVPNEQFGRSVDVDGNRMVVTAPNADVLAGSSFPGAGAVYVYDRPAADAQWRLSARIVSPDPVAGGNFGDSVALLGDRVAIGQSDITAGQNDDGLVYVFQRDASGIWVDQFSPPIDRAPADSTYDGFGASLAWVDADRLVIGAPGVSAGAGEVYDVALTSTFAVQLIAGPGSLAGDQIGYSIDVDERPGGGYSLVAGAPGIGVDEGGILMYSAPVGGAFTWNQGFSGGSANLRMGTAVSVSGDKFVVAGNSAGLGPPTGRVESYRFSGASWDVNSAQLVTSLANNVSWPPEVNDFLSLEGDTVAVGIPRQPGGARVLTDNGTGWVASPDITSPSAGAGAFGSSVALDAASLVIGDPLDSPATLGGSVYSVDNPATTIAAPTLDFALGLAAGAPSSVTVAPNGISVNQIDRAAVAGSGGGSNVAASSITTIGVDDTALAQVAIGSTPLSAIVLDSAPLSAIPLSAIDVKGAGGWPALLTGSNLSQYPLTTITFGEALTDGTVAGRIAALPLSAIDVDGTPLSAIPLSAIALGSTPLSAIPLSAIGTADPNPWCAIVADLIEDQACETALAELTLMEVTLRGVPLSAIPLSAIPLSAIDLSKSPLSAIPLSAIDLSKSPLSAIPLSAIPLSAIDVAGSPLSAIPLSAIPLSAIPLSAIPLSAIDVSGTPLSAIPLSAIPLSAIDVEGLAVEGSPLSAIPLSAIPLSAIPLSAIPLSAIPLSAIPLSAIPLSAIPLSAISVAGSPLSAIPLSAIDLATSPLSAIPLSAIPLSAIDPAASPLSAIPLSAIPLSAIPLSAIPLSAISVSGSPLSAIPLSAIDVLGSPLSAIPLSAIPLSAIPLSAIDCNRIDCARATLGEGFQRGAVSPGLTLGQIQVALTGIGLGELAPYLSNYSVAQLTAALAGHTLGELSSAAELTLGLLPQGHPALANVDLGDLGAALATVTLGDLIGLVDPTTGATLTGSDLIATLGGTTARQLVEGGAAGDMTIGDLTGSANATTTLDALGALLGYINIASLEQAFDVDVPASALSGQLGTLTEQQLGNLTLLDLLDEMGTVELGALLDALDLDGFTLGDLLLAMLDPQSLAYGGSDFATVDVAALPSGTVGDTSFAATFTLGGSSPRQVSVQVDLPTSASYVPASATISANDGLPSPLEPTLVGRTLVWKVDATPGSTYDIEFDVLPTMRLGTTTLGATARVTGTGISIPATAGVTVQEGLEPNDYLFDADGIPETTPAADDTMYLTYISSPTDRDVFEIDLAQNDALIVNLSNLDADLDVVLWGRADDAARRSSLSGVSTDEPLVAITDPDGATVPAAPLNDFARLDGLDSTLKLIASSNNGDLQDESLSTDRLPAGTYYVQVYGANGAINVDPAVLQLKVKEAEDRPECVANPIGDWTGTYPAVPTIPTDANTLILVNETRTELLYPGQSDDLLAGVDRLSGYLAAHRDLGVTPVVVPVDAYEAVRDAYDDWDAASCDPNAANGVVGAINNVIGTHRDQFDNIVVLGGDEVIPMARLADHTLVANEYEFRNEFNRLNSLTAAAWESYILSDEPYGDAAARQLGDRYLYVTDVALGRLVETPSEIVEALDNFATFNGTLAIDTATVLGYDFLADGSAQVATELDANGVTADSDLADGFVGAVPVPPATGGDKWDRLDARNKLQAAGTRAIVSLNAHFDHYRALPSNGDKVAGFNDNLVATDVKATLGEDALEQSLVFSMGCHSGLSVSDVLIGGAANDDWAQTLGSMGSLFVGNTGFGYGDTASVAYTEQLMALFAAQLTEPFDLQPGDGSSSSTVGQALAWAKNEYVAGLQTFSVYDEKAVQESTFYGLPFYKVGLSTTPLPPAPTIQPAPDATGTPAANVTVDSANTIRSEGALGSYYAHVDADGIDQTIVAPGRPIQPKANADITATSGVAQGAIVLGMTSTYAALPNPVIATPVFDEAGKQPEPPVGDVAFPTTPLEITSTTGPSGPQQQLVVATGQYRSDSGQQRLDDNIRAAVYYAAPAEADHTPPTIGTIESVLDNGVLTIGVTTTDEDSGVDRVYVLVARNPGVGTLTWTGLDLTLRSDGRWSGVFPLGAGVTDVEFLVQAKDDAGNVGYATNKARGYAAEPSSEVPAPPINVLTAAVTGPTGPAGTFTGPVTVSITSTTPTTYSVDGSAPVATPAANSFAISAEGLHTWKVVSPLTGWERTGSVMIAPGQLFVSGTVAPGANSAGWHAGPATVTWSVAGSSVAAPPATSLASEGVYNVVSEPVCASQSQCATGTVEVKIDLTHPTIEAITSSPGNAAGWDNEPVTVTFHCDDAWSGVAFCPEPVELGEGANQTVSGSATDRADWSASATSRDIDIDLTLPTINWSPTAPADDAIVIGSAYVAPTCTGSDGLSGVNGNGNCVVAVERDMTPSGTFVETATATVVDKAGNEATSTRTYTVTESSGPTITSTATPAANAHGWWKAPVTFSFACADPSGVATCPASVTVSTEETNQSRTVSAVDSLGNGSSLTVPSINVDLTDPTLNVTVSSASVTPLDNVTITCAASDARSGLDPELTSCQDSTFPASTLQVGSNTFTFTATDNAGRTTTVTKRITLDIPVNPAPTVRADMGVTGLGEIGFQSNIVVLTGSFSDPNGPGPYTASVRWQAGAPFTPFIVNNGSEFAAAHLYGSTGMRTVTVKICDASGACGTDDLIVRSNVTQKITPVRECVADRGAGQSPRYSAKWGYNNPATYAIAVPSIPVLENTFTAAPYLRGQPQIFKPGQQRGVFTTTFANGTQTWRLNGTTASALNSSPRC